MATVDNYFQNASHSELLKPSESLLELFVPATPIGSIPRPAIKYMPTNEMIREESNLFWLNIWKMMPNGQRHSNYLNFEHAWYLRDGLVLAKCRIKYQLTEAFQGQYILISFSTTI